MVFAKLDRLTPTVRRSGGGNCWLFPEISPEVSTALKDKWFTRYLREV